MDGFVNGINLGGWLSQYQNFDHDHFRNFITRRQFCIQHRPQCRWQRFNIIAVGIEYVHGDREVDSSKEKRPAFSPAVSIYRQVSSLRYPPSAGATLLTWEKIFFSKTRRVFCP